MVHIADLVQQFPPEKREQGRRLNARYGALVAATKELSGEKRIASEAYRDGVLEDLEELKREIADEFRTWREAYGIPGV